MNIHQESLRTFKNDELSKTSICEQFNVLLDFHPVSL